ncbi:MAG: TPM domain-containing protein [Proteobacteria bacterium]|nr:TPM domain-containing protein [Pseudomonadota bacterium]MBU1709442.1 TPM domain-containing protein [Pseudomonadota bacterium]
MKYRHSLFIAFLCFLLLTAGCNKAKENPVPVRLGLVNDYASVFSPEETDAMAADLAAYEKETCHQIIVLTVPSLSGESIASFSSRTANDWDIGQEMLDNGILLTLAMEEKSVRIEAGTGLEFIAKDEVGKQILDEEILPSFRQGRMTEGVNKGISAIKKAARLVSYPDNHRPSICLGQ